MLSASHTNWKELPKMQFALPNNAIVTTRPFSLPSRYIDRENYCHVTNKQTNALLSIKTPTMSRRYQFLYSIKITVLWYTIDSHNIFFHWNGY
jgi:hypothetical protein